MSSPLTFLSLSGVPTVPSPHSSAGSEQHLQEKWLFLLFLGVTGSLIPTVFIPVPQCCLSREGWALLLPHRGWVLAAAQAPPQHLPLTKHCRVQGSMGNSAASTAQLHSPACASCSTCLRHPHPLLWLLTRCHCPALLWAGVWDTLQASPSCAQCVQSTLQMLVCNLCQTTLNKFLQKKNNPPLVFGAVSLHG